jgi:hypothetical protein
VVGIRDHEKIIPDLESKKAPDPQHCMETVVLFSGTFLILWTKYKKAILK